MFGSSPLEPQWQGQWVIQVTDRGVEALAPGTGQVRWRYPLPPHIPTLVTQVIATEQVVIARYNQWPKGRPRETHVVAIRAKDGHVLWHRVDAGERIFVGEDVVYTWTPGDLLLRAFDIWDGHLLWSHRGCQGNLTSEQDHLFVYCGDSNLMRMESRTGRVLQIRQLPRADRVFVSDNVVLLARYNIEEPTQWWEEPLAFTTLQAWDWDTGELLWERILEGRITSFLLAEGTVVYKAGPEVRRVRLRNEQVVWKTALPETVGANFVRVGAVLLVGSGAGFMHALDWETGFRLWEQDLWPTSAPFGPSVRVLGVYKRRIILAAVGKAIVGLASHGLSALPTPTPVKTPVIEPKLVLPSPPLPCTTPQNTATVADKVRAIAMILSCHPDDFTQVEQALHTWLDLDASCPSPLYWTHRVDLNDDGRDEYVLAFALSIRSPRWNPCAPDMSTWAILGRDLRGYFVIYYLGQEPAHNTSMREPRLVFARDINADGRTEIVVRTYWFGACTGFVITSVGQWHEGGWRVLAHLENMGNHAWWEDVDGDGRLEYLVHGNTPGCGAYFGRASTWVYAWQGGRLQLQEKRPDTVDIPYFLMIDANRALAQGDLDRVLSLVRRALTLAEKPSSEADMAGPKWQARIASYAAIQAMIVHALRHEPGAMEAYLREIEVRFNRPDNFYVNAARELWRVYQATEDAVLACRAVERYVRRQGGPALLYAPTFMVSEALGVDQICPLDGPAGELTP